MLVASCNLTETISALGPRPLTPNAKASHIAMKRHGKIDLKTGRLTSYTVVGFADEDDHGDLIKRQEKVKRDIRVNSLLNKQSAEIVDAIKSRLWATMYLRYLLGRMNDAEPAHIRFPDLAGVQTLSLEDERQPPPPSEEQTFEDWPVDRHMQVLDRRLRDARIGLRDTWAALNQLVSQLTSGEAPFLSR
jgi:hypothetical protein